jgi:hypothetical protein
LYVHKTMNHLGSEILIDPQCSDSGTS